MNWHVCLSYHPRSVGVRSRNTTQVISAIFTGSLQRHKETQRFTETPEGQWEAKAVKVQFTPREEITSPHQSRIKWFHLNSTSNVFFSKLSFSLAHVHKLEAGLTHPEGQMTSFQITATLYSRPALAAVEQAELFQIAQVDGL